MKKYLNFHFDCNKLCLSTNILIVNNYLLVLTIFFISCESFSLHYEDYNILFSSLYSNGYIVIYLTCNTIKLHMFVLLKVLSHFFQQKSPIAQHKTT